MLLSCGTSFPSQLELHPQLIALKPVSRPTYFLLPFLHFSVSSVSSILHCYLTFFFFQTLPYVIHFIHFNCVFYLILYILYFVLSSFYCVKHFILFVCSTLGCHWYEMCYIKKKFPMTQEHPLGIPGSVSSTNHAEFYNPNHNPNPNPNRNPNVL